MIRDVNLDIQILAATKSVHRDIMESTAEKHVADTVERTHHVIVSTESVRVVVKMVSLEHIVTILVRKDISVHTVHGFAPQTVNLAHVNTRTDHVLVLQAGWVIIVLQHVMRLLERIVSTNAVLAVSTRYVTESTAIVCMVVMMESNVNRILT